MGIESYDAALRGAREPKGERDHLVGEIAPDETLVSRHRGMEFFRGGQKLADPGAGYFVTDRRLLVVSPPKGLFRPKFQTWSFPYAELEPTMARTSYELVPGSRPIHAAGWQSRRLGGDTFIANFVDEDDREAFYNDAQPRMISWS